MIFFKNSPRNISFKKAKTLIASTPESLTPIAVLVDPSLEFIKELVNIGIKDIQLHGSETVAFCKKIKKEFKVKVYKAINLKKNEDLLLVNKYRIVADWVLFDYKDEKSLGGTGKSFDWEILRDKNLKYNWILSGGLDYNNIENAILQSKPPIFWKEKEIVKRQISNSSKTKIEKIIFKINSIEEQVKANSQNSIYILSDFLINETSA